MPTVRDRLPFVKEQLLGVAEEGGVYVLWAGMAALHVGSTEGEAVGLRTKLQRHLIGVQSPSPPQATHFSYEVSSDRRARHIEIVAEIGRRI